MIKQNQNREIRYDNFHTILNDLSKIFKDNRKNLESSKNNNLKELSDKTIDVIEKEGNQAYIKYNQDKINAMQGKQKRSIGVRFKEH